MRKWKPLADDSSSGISGGTAAQIALDVGNDVKPKDSKLDYGPAELEFRRGIERRFAAYKQEHPDAVIDVKE